MALYLLLCSICLIAPTTFIPFSTVAESVVKRQHEIHGSLVTVELYRPMPDQVIEINPELHEITFISVDVSSYGRFLSALF